MAISMPTIVCPWCRVSSESPAPSTKACARCPHCREALAATEVVDWKRIANEFADDSPPPRIERRDFSPPRGRAMSQAARILLALCGLGETAIAGVFFWAMMDDAGAPRVTQVVLACNFFEKIGFLVTGIFFALWLRESHRNVHNLCGPKLLFPSGVAIFWIFLPFANLALAYVSIHDVWTASEPGPGLDEDLALRRRDSRSMLVLAWAALWAGAHLLGWSALFVSEDGIRMAAGLLVAHLLLAIDALLAILVIQALTRRQEALWRSVTGGVR
jgi:hypothetical protein